MLFGTAQWVLVAAALGAAGAERWRWPADSQPADSVRIDAKVGFVDVQGTNKRNNRDNVQADEISFLQPAAPAGYHGAPERRPPARGDDRDIRINGRPAYNDDRRNQNYQDGTLDSLQYCKCVSTPDCEVRNNYAKACGANQYLCCYNRQNGLQSDFFNEVDDERQIFPSQSNNVGPFARPYFENNGIFGQSQPGVLVGPGGPTGVIGPQRKPVLVGPNGPTGVIGPGRPNRVERPVLVGPGGPNRLIGSDNNKPVLVGPGGPTGVIGPNRPIQSGPNGYTGVLGSERPVLVGPEGPNGVIGPDYNKPVLVGPEGPTGIIGPNKPIQPRPNGYTGVTGSERPILVGPDGPNGVIGPDNNKPVLVGPEGPTGIIGPNKPIQPRPNGYTGATGLERPVLVGPEGPTGIIGPANDYHDDNLLVRPLEHPDDIRESETAQRGVLVGPGGPTGIIGPAFNRPGLYGSAFNRPGLYGSTFNRPILVGPNGPTGLIGPRLVGPGGPTGIIGPAFNRPSRGPGILVGPGGPTGVIGPGRPILVGPRGPTGRIGPRNFFGIQL